MHKQISAKIQTIQIDYYIKCPICKSTENHIQNLHTGDIECECGCILQTQHNYVAGIKIKK